MLKTTVGFIRINFCLNLRRYLKLTLVSNGSFILRLISIFLGIGQQIIEKVVMECLKEVLLKFFNATRRVEWMLAKDYGLPKILPEQNYLNVSCKKKYFKINLMRPYSHGLFLRSTFISNLVYKADAHAYRSSQYLLTLRK